MKYYAKMSYPQFGGCDIPETKIFTSLQSVKQSFRAFLTEWTTYNSIVKEDGYYPICDVCINEDHDYLDFRLEPVSNTDHRIKRIEA
jgi:hypothetical protein